MCILDGSLLPDEALAADAHLDQCPSCRSLLVTLVKVLPELAHDRKLN